MFVGQVLVNDLVILWINHRILFLSMLVGCAEITYGEHGHCLLLWMVKSVHVSLGLLSQVHHCIITVILGNVTVDIFHVLFRRVIIEM